MEQKYKHSDLFLTHTWRADMQGRDNHARVRIVNEELNRLGFSTWFDEKSMSGDIKAKMAEGVDFTRCVIVFVTEQYMLKIDSPDEDNCKFEFDRALTQKTNKNILCVVMEEQFDSSSNWFGKLDKTLGGCLYVSMSGDLTDKHYLRQQLQLVVEQLNSKGVAPSQTKNKCEDCTLTNKNGEQQPFFADGDACTFCGEDLKKTTDPKNYCASCSIHSNGSFCQICKVHLLDKNQRIHELEKQLLKVISLELNMDLSKYKVENFKAEIEKMKQELVDILVKRGEIQSSGVKLQINETEYINKVDDLQKKMESILTNTTHLATAKEDVLKNLEPLYNVRLTEFEEMMRSLEDNRKDLQKRTEQLFRGKDELEKLKKEVQGFVEKAVEGEKHLHGKNCSCDDCSFERELTSKMISNGPQYLEALISANEIEKIERAITLKSEIKATKKSDGVNLLLSITFKHGTFEMLMMLLKKEIYIDIDGMKFMFLWEREDNLLKKIISENKIKELQLLIESQKDIMEAKEISGFNLLLSLTMQYGTVDMLVMLLEMGARVDIDEMEKHLKYLGERNPLLKIISDNKVEYLQLIIKYQQDIVEAKYEDGFNLLLSLTMQYGRTDMFIMLLKMGIRVDIDTIGKLLKTIGENNLVRKIIIDSDIEGLKEIIKLQNDIISAENESGSNLLLLLTVQHGTVEMFNMLLEMGIEADKMNNFHKTLLHYVKIVDIAQLLCEKYGDKLLKIKDRGGFTPFMLAHHNNSLNLLEAMKPFVNQEEEISNYNYLLASWKDVPNYDYLQQLEREGLDYVKKLIEKNDITTMATLITHHSSLIESQKDIMEAKDRSGFNLLLSLAIKHSTVDMLVMLLEMGARVDIDEMGKRLKMIRKENTLLKIISEDKVEYLQLIIKYQQDIVEAKYGDGFNLLLSLTMQYGRTDMFIMLLKMGIRVDIDTIGKLLKTIGENNLVRKIIIDSDIEGLKEIIKLQNDIISAENESGSNLLLLLTVQHGTVEMFNMLLEMGIEADKMNDWHKTLLHYVKIVDIAQLLCEKYGDTMLKIKDRGGFTPFMLAHHNNSLTLLEAMKPFVNQEEEISNYNYLLASWKDVPNYDYLQQLEREGLAYVKKLIEKNDITTMATLITLKPDVVNMIDENNYTPFLQCCGYGSMDMLMMLVEQGSDVNKYDNLGNTAVMLAVMYNTTEWFEEMVEHLCTTQPQPLTAETFNGFSVFHGAASRNREDLIPNLLKHSPPPQLLVKKNKWGDSPIDVAKQRRFKPIVQMYENYIKNHKENTTTTTE